MRSTNCPAMEDMVPYNGYCRNYLVHRQRKGTRKRQPTLEQFKVTSTDLLNLAYSRSTELKHGKHSFVGIADKEYKEEFYLRHATAVPGPHKVGDVMPYC